MKLFLTSTGLENKDISDYFKIGKLKNTFNIKYINKNM